MAIILILRCARAETERLEKFLEKYKTERPDHQDFISETLTRIDNSENIDESMKGLFSPRENSVLFLNVAHWKSAKSFFDHFTPKAGYYDPEIESEPRVRAVLEEIERP